MGAPERVSKAAAIASLERWRGNVEGAADELHIAPNNLRNCIKRFSIDLQEIRIRTHPQDQNGPNAPVRMERGRSDGPDDQQSASAIFPSANRPPTVSTVSSVVPEFARRGEKPIRVLPDHGDRIRRGRRRLSAEADSDLDDSALLAQFIDERFEGWLDEMVARVRREKSERADEQEGEPKT